ncbi:hypothetical protein OK016_27465 [Vibrio chagasii]|nr:hypothetical protein [Vibrio chagasii]
MIALFDDFNDIFTCLLNLADGTAPMRTSFLLSVVDAAWVNDVKTAILWYLSEHKPIALG